jgi:hypothetical protein
MDVQGNPQHEKKHILVIDDDAALIALLREYLHCVITGINQPGMDGLEFTELSGYVGALMSPLCQNDA